MKFIIIYLLCLSSRLYAENDSVLFSLFDKSIEELINQEVTIATKSSQKLTQTPSIVSVITADDIKNMGAREMEDVLRTIPGFELSRSYAGYYTMGVRGVRDSRAFSKILIMIDGIPFNQIFYGSYVDWGFDIDLDAIERIEIIRGPGSALYGRNAFSAVINFITKEGGTSEKVKLKTSYGNFNSKNFSGYFGYDLDKLNLSFAVRKLTTDVANSEYDQGGGQLSTWNIHRDNLWLNSNIGYDNFTISGMYLKLTGGAIFNDNRIKNEIGNYSIQYKNRLNSKISVNAKLFGHNSTYTEDVEQLKPGVLPDYPDGIYYKPNSNEYLYGLETEISYKLLSNNNLLFGVQADIHGVHNVNITSNVDLVSLAPLPGIGRENQVLYGPGWFENNEHHYNNKAFFIQDIWYPIDIIGITLGGRYDFDSEIGAVISPRVGLVIEPFASGNIKVLYGRAYRAPAPADQYVTLGYAFGNKDLKPEIINSLELALNYRQQRVTHSLNIFRNKLTDMIYAAQLAQIDPNNKYYNIGENISTGIEYENKLYFGKSFYSFINYSFTNSVNTDFINDNDTSYNHPNVSPHKLNAGINYLFLKYFKLNFNTYYRGEMSKYRILGTNMEVRDPLGDYAIVNSNLQVDNLVKNFNFSIAIFNIFDTKYYSQDNQHLTQPPQAGRQIIGTLAYSIK